MEPARKKRSSDGRQPAKRRRRIYTLRVELRRGPVTAEFVNANPVVSRLSNGDSIRIVPGV